MFDALQEFPEDLPIERDRSLPMEREQIVWKFGLIRIFVSIQLDDFCLVDDGALRGGFLG